MLVELLAVAFGAFLLLMGGSGVFAAPKIVEAQRERDVGSQAQLPIEDATRITLVRVSGVVMLLGGGWLLVTTLT